MPFLLNTSYLRECCGVRLPCVGNGAHDDRHGLSNKVLVKKTTGTFCAFHSPFGGHGRFTDRAISLPFRTSCHEVPGDAFCSAALC